MIWSGEFVALDKILHDRTSFDCGEDELNTFLKKFASRHMEANISTTMLLPASRQLPDGKYPICAFYTVTPGSISRETLPEAYRKRLPYYPVPVFLIAQMAVHSDCQRQGLGKVTLIKALEHLWRIHFYMKAHAVIVDCLNRNAETFFAKYGFETLCLNNDRVRMFLPMKTVENSFRDI